MTDTLDPTPRDWSWLADEVATRSGLIEGAIAIDGPSGAGKSTFAAELVRAFADRSRASVLISTDDYATWDDPAAWWPELERDVLGAYERNHDYSYSPRVWVDGHPQPGPEQWVRWQPILIVEGVTCARRSSAHRFTQRYWLDGPDPEQRLARTVARDGEAERDHLTRWQHFEKGWFAVDKTRSRCEVLSSISE
ncbi:uridine kinase family protein [Gordonia sp. (in: high G+C Gram-positive bacteria)]|uniref:uridine kinase family protein n=1 Tax=Gordonia sp. (in: high G+C Gram-positive bacteria) TaxID=84139 RepID=UPI003C771682